VRVINWVIGMNRSAFLSPNIMEEKRRRNNICYGVRILFCGKRPQREERWLPDNGICSNLYQARAGEAYYIYINNKPLRPLPYIYIYKYIYKYI